MDNKTLTIIGLTIILLCVVFYFVYKKEEGYCGCSGPDDFRTLNTVNDMGQPWKFKKCLCSQMGNKYYPSEDALTRKIFRDVSEWGYNGEVLTQQELDSKNQEFAGVV